MRKFLLISMAVILILFVLPALAHLGVWSLKQKPGSWRQADWSSAGILPSAVSSPDAEIMVMDARTGGLKGAFATHSWLVLKKAGASRYDRYDVVGWGRPVRKNAYDPDGKWYSNPPTIHYRLTGKKAENLIPKIEAAIAHYPWNRYGDYTIWPGPNSNTFVAAILSAVPELETALPSTAIGKDFPADGKWLSAKSGNDWYLTFGGYAGVRLGRKAGFELNFLGLVAGWNPLMGRIKVPGFGEF